MKETYIVIQDAIRKL